ncbi:glycosyltransferase BC10-like [Alnus glutinosa]|uniref:glycosyltransferase BC10-like n=1 Tax=Alnus glutinosa TaxID=3517 RepID=UPI002D79E6BD|nr:glycosyltransferase BC10-like [Alnus glutinosa]
MTKKKASSSPIRHVVRLFSRLTIFLCVLLCLLAFLMLHHSQSKLQTPIFPSPTTRRLRDDHHFEGPSKIAFLFLVRRDLPLDFLWGAFFKNGDEAKFSIYIHSEPGFVFDETTASSAFFYGRQLKNSIQVVWGELSMIEAERLLLDKALDDPANQRFVLLSDSCVPLYNFSYIYNKVMSSPKSFVDSFLDAKERRYNPKMSPTIPEEKWRKGSQWITLVRRHAEIIVDDDIIFPVFRKFCKRRRRPPINSMKRRQLLNFLAIDFRFLFPWLKHHNCIPDEHYVPTLLAMRGLEGELERRTLTYTSWNQSAMREKRRSWHPITFDYADANPHKIKEIKDINHVYYESEHRTEFCRINSKLSPCFLFARKFTCRAAIRLSNEGLLSPYITHTISNTRPWMTSLNLKRKGNQDM